ncbi:unnamed protein product [Ostreobium quekettii]|uniref:Uncharacterized protein n=1 Tax=Ostreobium quekettii TaxID=121088 RepID=A0A8S1IT63_9CHLO|nr:unnamed protein product [Ostreobium quekettii]|eukprot:evm.model.scf_16.2 EVM.evm.TU.scf_16.2   scf_16:17141-18816(+)
MRCLGEACGCGTVGSSGGGRCFSGGDGFGGAMMHPSPFEVRDRGGWGRCRPVEAGVFREAFSDFERMWADKWHGKDDAPEPLSAADPRGSIIGALLRTLTSLTSIGSRIMGSPPQGGAHLLGTPSSGLQTTASWDDDDRRGLFSAQSWKRLFSGKPSGPKYTKSGPCELFADWPIPPYPEDYEWDD